MFLVIYYVVKLEKKIDLNEENYKKDNDLRLIRSDVEALKLIIGGDIKKWIKKGK